MPRFSQYFGLNAGQAQLDFVNIDTDADTPVFIDPYAIEIRTDSWSNRCAEAVRVFFDEVLCSLRNLNEGHARYLVAQLQEPSETFLGLSKEKPKGRGVGAHQSGMLLEAIRSSKGMSEQRILLRRRSDVRAMPGIRQLVSSGFRAASGAQVADRPIPDGLLLMPSASVAPGTGSRGRTA